MSTLCFNIMQACHIDCKFGLCIILCLWAYFFCLQGDYRPDMIIITEGLLLVYGEEKREDMEIHALRDAKKKFRHGLSPLFYGDIPYLPFYTATGNLVRFHLLLADGSVSLCLLLSALLNTCMRVYKCMPVCKINTSVAAYRSKTAKGDTICSLSITGQSFC